MRTTYNHRQLDVCIDSEYWRSDGRCTRARPLRARLRRGSRLDLNAVNALINPPTAPIPGAGQTPPALHLAMVHGAVYDAVNCIDGGHQSAVACTAGAEPGQGRPIPPGNVSDPFAWVANVQLFVLQSPSQFQSKGPLDVRSRAYAKEYSEVKELGEADSVRTERAGCASGRQQDLHPT